MEMNHVENLQSQQGRPFYLSLLQVAPAERGADERGKEERHAAVPIAEATGSQDFQNFRLDPDVGDL